MKTLRKLLFLAALPVLFFACLQPDGLDRSEFPLPTHDAIREAVADVLIANGHSAAGITLSYAEHWAIVADNEGSAIYNAPINLTINTGLSATDITAALAGDINAAVEPLFGNFNNTIIRTVHQAPLPTMAQLVAAIEAVGVTGVIVEDYFLDPDVTGDDTVWSNSWLGTLTVRHTSEYSSATEENIRIAVHRLFTEAGFRNTGRFTPFTANFNVIRIASGDQVNLPSRQDIIDSLEAIGAENVNIGWYAFDEWTPRWWWGPIEVPNTPTPTNSGVRIELNLNIYRNSNLTANLQATVRQLFRDAGFTNDAAHSFSFSLN